MKKDLVAAFSVLMLCSLLLITTVGIVTGGNPEYSIIEYWTQVAPTFDGEWTIPDEWTDGQHVQISDVGMFTYTADISLTGSYNSQFLVEFFNDTTDDPEDFWQICIDPSNDGGSAPQTGYGRIDIIGHTDMVCYIGNGTGWIITDDIIEWANAIADSPLNSTPHWILELQFNKISGSILLDEPPNGLRIAVYDASNPDAGVQAWPPDSDVNVPNEWGVVPTYSEEPIPEGLNLAVMVFLSSVSLVVGARFLQKRSKRKEK